MAENRVRSYDSLLESDPEFQQQMAESKLEGKRELLMFLVRTRFPHLVEKAEQKVVQLNKTDDLNRLTQLMINAPDEKTAQWVLDAFGDFVRHHPHHQKRSFISFTHIDTQI